MLEIIKKIPFWIKNGLIIACWRFQKLPWTDIVHFAVDTENFDLLSWCLQGGADINMQYPDGRTLIHHAVERKSRQMIDFLFENGADPNKTDLYNVFPLQLAALYQYENILEALLDHENVNPNI